MEDEVVKHTKKVIDTMKNRKHSFGEKFKEILIEIFIIVFAVTLSIWLHSWQEHSHEQKDVTEFLADLKDDLNKDITSMTDEKNDLTKALENDNYFENIDEKKADSLKSHSSHANFNMNLTIRKSNVGNYEGFKSSGKIGFIENKSLKKLILKYYQQDVPALEDLERFYNSKITKVTDYIASQDDHYKMLTTPQFKTLLDIYMQSVNNNITAYNAFIGHAKEIVTEIEKEANKISP